MPDGGDNPGVASALQHPRDTSWRARRFVRDRSGASCPRGTVAKVALTAATVQPPPRSRRLMRAAEMGAAAAARERYDSTDGKRMVAELHSWALRVLRVLQPACATALDGCRRGATLSARVGRPLARPPPHRQACGGRTDGCRPQRVRRRRCILREIGAPMNHGDFRKQLASALGACPQGNESRVGSSATARGVHLCPGVYRTSHGRTRKLAASWHAAGDALLHSHSQVGALGGPM